MSTFEVILELLGPKIGLGTPFDRAGAALAVMYVQMTAKVPKIDERI